MLTGDSNGGRMQKEPPLVRIDSTSGRSVRDQDAGYMNGNHGTPNGGSPGTPGTGGSGGGGQQLWKKVMTRLKTVRHMEEHEGGESPQLYLRNTGGGDEIVLTSPETTKITARSETMTDTLSNIPPAADPVRRAIVSSIHSKNSPST